MSVPVPLVSSRQVREFAAETIVPVSVVEATATRASLSKVTSVNRAPLKAEASCAMSRIAPERRVLLPWSRAAIEVVVSTMRTMSASTVEFSRPDSPITGCIPMSPTSTASTMSSTIVAILPRV